MSRLNSRGLQEELLERMKEYCSADAILDHILEWVDSDTACDGLKDMCRDWDIDVDDITEEDE